MATMPRPASRSTTGRGAACIGTLYAGDLFAAARKGSFVREAPAGTPKSAARFALREPASPLRTMPTQSSPDTPAQALDAALRELARAAALEPDAALRAVLEAGARALRADPAALAALPGADADAGAGPLAAALAGEREARLRAERALPSASGGWSRWRGWRSWGAGAGRWPAT